MRPQIDTRRIVDGLRDHFTPEQVAALTIVIVETLPEIVATKGDVDLLRAEIVTTRGDLTLMRALRGRAARTAGPKNLGAGTLGLGARFLDAVHRTPVLVLAGIFANALATAVMAFAVMRYMGR